MDLSLDESQEILVHTFAELLERECPITLVRDCENPDDSADSGGDVVHGTAAALWQRYCELGAHVMGLPESAGGLEMSLFELGLVATQSGRALAPVPLIEVAVTGRLLAALDPQDPLLAELVEGTTCVSLALPRPHAVIGTRSRKTERVIVPYGAMADHVIALSNDELIVASNPSARRSQRLRDAGSGALAHWDLSRTEGTDVRVLATGAAAQRALEQATAEWKLLCAFWLVGLAQRALEIGSEYARERIQFGAPIGGFQGIAHPLADCATRVDGAELLAWEAAWSHTEEPQRFETLASMAFVWASQTAMRTADVSLHTHGGYGFSSEYDIQLYYRRAGALAGVAGGSREELQTVAELCFDAPNRTSNQTGI